MHSSPPKTGSLTVRLVAALALVALVVVAGMGAYAYSWARRSEVEHELNDLRILSEHLAARIDLSLAAGRGLADHLACTRDAQEYLGQGARQGPPQEAIQAWLGLQAGRTPGHSAIFLMSPRGICLASSDPAFIGRDFSFRSYFREAMEGRIATSDWIIGSVTRTPRVFSAAPVRVGGGIVGVLVTEFRVEEVEASVRALGDQGRVAAVFNAQGIILAHTEAGAQYHALEPLDAAAQAELGRTRQFLGRDIPPYPISPGFVSAFKRVRATSRPETLNYRLGATAKWGALAPLAQRPWVVLVAIPEHEILLPVRKALATTLLVAFATALGAVALGFLLARPHFKPLK